MTALGPHAHPWTGSGPKLTGHVLEARYELLEPIGRGGMAEVYKAYFIPGGSVHAVKLLRRGSAADPELTRRFSREFRALHQLDHVGIVHASDFGRASDGRPYFVMELLKGESLHTLLEHTLRLEPARAVRLALQACDALEAMHSAGIVHRDLKPGNLFIQEGDRVKLIDLGIARLTDAYYARDGRYVTPPSQRIITPRAHILGTPGYIAPEIRQERAGPRADVFGLGVVLYQMLTGELPFRAGDTNYATPSPGTLDSLPRSLKRAVRTAIEIEANERYQSVRELHMDLEDALLDLSDDSELHRLDEQRSQANRAAGGGRTSWFTIFALGAVVGGAGVLVEERSIAALQTPSQELSFVEPASPGEQVEPIPPPAPAAAMSSEDEPEAEVAPTRTAAEPEVVPERVVADSTPVPVSPPPPTNEKPTKIRQSRTRVPASFATEMDRARPALAACLRFVPHDDEIAIVVKVRNGAASITSLPETPASVRRCLERAISTLSFEVQNFSATYRIKP